jgi:hypothetical protein
MPHAQCATVLGPYWKGGVFPFGLLKTLHQKPGNPFLEDCQLLAYTLECWDFDKAHPFTSCVHREMFLRTPFCSHRATRATQCHTGQPTIATLLGQGHCHTSLVSLCLGRPAVGLVQLSCVWPAGGESAHPLITPQKVAAPTMTITATTRLQSGCPGLGTLSVISYLRACNTRTHSHKHCTTVDGSP